MRFNWLEQSRSATLVVWGMLLVSACQSPSYDKALPGMWQAVSLTVQDSIWDVETDPVRLTLDASGAYTLQWYNHEQEMGVWEHRPPHLMIRSEPGGKRHMTILELEDDRLVLQGLQEARTIRLGFTRMLPDPKEAHAKE